jgi:hypothetical protein
MSVVSRARVVPKAVIAALVGTVGGAAVGVWSLRQPATRANISASPLVAPAMKTAVSESDAGSSRSTSLPKPIPTATETTGAPTNAAPPSSVDDAQVLQRARTLARHPDVTGLIALREDVVRHATERGIADSTSVKGELAEIDLRLNEARMLQLKLDAEELRKADSKATR